LTSSSMSGSSFPSTAYRIFQTLISLQHDAVTLGLKIDLQDLWQGVENCYATQLLHRVLLTTNQQSLASVVQRGSAFGFGVFRAASLDRN
jgi:hypothetical protein